ncbi:hypothetical protein FY122_00535 [Dictyoglomus thermophilum]|uniref:hypothetical protein n=1 Tax=Dictyoglomus thermophilum TaxID=14 RepID=UPI0011EAE153|nr:hypothetical protein [Dictyoglomus thermophilum]TYT24065.1 hypothetical protein FY122_00535 [Dictyoglomus thermophilum]
MKKIILLIFILIFLTSISYPQEPSFNISLGINSEWKLERFSPLFIEIYNPGNRLTLKIEVIYNQGLRYAGYCETIYQENVEIPPLATKKIEFLIPPIDFRYPLRVRIWHNNKLLREEKIEISFEKIVLPLILILGKNIPQLPISQKARILRIYDERLLPLNYKAYDTYDLVLIDKDFWKTLPQNLKNSITMYKILTGRVYFMDEIKKISLELLKIPPVSITIPHNTILYNPDISLLQGQKFLYPDRFTIVIALFVYFLFLFVWKRYLLRKRFSFIIFSIFILLSSVFGFQIKNYFEKDALAISERSIIYLDPETFVAENYFNLSIFSPFKRNLSFNYSPNIFLLYNAYYQPQKGKISLIIDRKENNGKITIERNRVYFLEGLSFHFLPINIEFRELSDRFILNIENDANFDLKDLILKSGNAENYIGSIMRGERKSIVVWKSGLKEPSLLNEILKNYRFKTPLISQKKILLWGRIKEPINHFNFEYIKVDIYRDNILIIPLEEKE